MIGPLNATSKSYVIVDCVVVLQEVFEKLHVITLIDAAQSLPSLSSLAPRTGTLAIVCTDKCTQQP